VGGIGQGGRRGAPRSWSSGIVIGDIAPISRLAKLEHQTLGSVPTNHELPVMDGAMMEIADGGEIPELVTASATLIFDVVQIEPDTPAASRHCAVIAVSGQDVLALAGRDSRGCPLRDSGIERAEIDGIAFGALEHGRIDFDVSTAAELPGSVTVRTPLDRDLVRG
jgi:hypothetical protein